MEFHLLCLLLLLSGTPPTHAGMFKNLGVNYGTLGSNLLSPARSVRFLQHLQAGATRIYDANSTILEALAGTHLQVSIGVPNEIIPAIAGNQSAADDWVRSNVLPFYHKTHIRFLYVGNEVLSYYFNSTWPYLMPAIVNIHRSLRTFSIRGIKVGTTVAMDVLQNYSPPSAGMFRPDIAESIVRPLLRFLAGTRSFFFVDAYPYFVWSANSTTIALDYALFQGKNKFVDPGSKLTYTNLLDQLLDAVVFAMRRLGYGKVPLVLAETGWPNGGDLDQIGANVRNAAIYNRNLARHMAARSGTPARPGVSIPTFIFALYNENMKFGPGTERHWGLLYPNGTNVYDIDLTGRRPLSSYAPLPPAANNKPYKGRLWCVFNAGQGNVEKAALGAALAYACGQGNGTCNAIQPGKECYKPNTLEAHASYAFNSYWQQFKNSGGTCFFGGLAVQTGKDPSYGSCRFPSLPS